MPSCRHEHKPRGSLADHMVVGSTKITVISPFCCHLRSPISFAIEVETEHLNSLWNRLSVTNIFAYILIHLDFNCKKSDKRPIKILIKYSIVRYLRIFLVLSPMTANDI